MPLSAGTRLGPDEILAPLGAGGMGEKVYRARPPSTALGSGQPPTAVGWSWSWDGAVKVLDFGLAKALEQGSGIGDQGSGSAANSPTIASPAMTRAGVILGTAAYMSPEQATGARGDEG